MYCSHSAYSSLPYNTRESRPRIFHRKVLLSKSLIYPKMTVAFVGSFQLIHPPRSDVIILFTKHTKETMFILQWLLGPSSEDLCKMSQCYHHFGEHATTAISRRTRNRAWMTFRRPTIWIVGFYSSGQLYFAQMS